MTNMSIQPLWLTHFIEILLVIEFQLTKFIVRAFSYKAHFRHQISSNVFVRPSKNVMKLFKQLDILLDLIRGTTRPNVDVVKIFRHLRFS